MTWKFCESEKSHIFAARKFLQMYKFFDCEKAPKIHKSLQIKKKKKKKKKKNASVTGEHFISHKITVQPINLFYLI